MQKSTRSSASITRLQDNSFQPSMFEIAEIRDQKSELRGRKAEEIQSPISDFSFPITVEDEAVNLAYEKEALGFYITGHPVRPFRDILKTFGVKSSEDLKSAIEVKNSTATAASGNQELPVAGLVLELKKHKTRGKNELMAFVTLEDEEGSLEVVVFPDLYKRSMELFEKGSIIVVKGYMESSEKGLKLIAKEIEDFESFIKNSFRGVSKVLLKVRPSDFKKEKFITLQDALKKRFRNSSIKGGIAIGEITGGLPLYIDLIMPDCTVTIQSSYSIAPDFRLLRFMEELFGRNSLEVIL